VYGIAYKGCTQLELGLSCVVLGLQRLRPFFAVHVFFIMLQRLRLFGVSLKNNQIQPALSLSLSQKNSLKSQLQIEKTGSIVNLVKRYNKTKI
jgi:hypothetical protein